MNTPEWLAENKEQQDNFERLRIKEQWSSQIMILSRSGILETFPDSKQLGIRGVNGNEYPVHKPEEIIARLKANREIMHKKIEQGFTKLIIEPFAYSFDALSEKYKRVILKHYKYGKILAAKERPTDPDESLALDENNPFRNWVNDYRQCDAEDKIVYFPKEFSNNHGGHTKRELLSTDVSSGFNIWLVEDMPNIPREGKGREIGERHQLETNKTPSEYLKLIQTNPMYEFESGLTPEVDIMYAITHLEETNQMINYYQGQRSLSYQIGGYFLASGSVPCSYWDRVNHQAGLSTINPAFRLSDCGARVGVRVL